MPTSARPEDDGVRVESLPDALAPVRDEIERMLCDIRSIEAQFQGKRKAMAQFLRPTRNGKVYLERLNS